jgi:hypothetical protein
LLLFSARTAQKEAFVDHPLPWLKYVDADDLDDENVDFDDMDVESPSGEHLGEVDGFIVDSESGRPYYLVVDAGGWFKSKHFLLPVGHVRLDADAEALKANLARDRVERFPGFNKDEFDKLTVDDLKKFNDQTLQVCALTTYTYSEAEPYSAAWDRPEFSYPGWWRSGGKGPQQARAAAVATGAGTAAATRSESFDRSIREGEKGVAHADPSPHFDGRAQPGDVIGIEEGGERTHVGETAEDENRRREEAEKAAAERRDRSADKH